MGRQARYVVQKAPGIGGNPIPEDEPCIVVRAQDQLAIAVIDHYLAIYRAILTHGGGDQRVLDELELHRDAIEVWQRHHPTKIADR